MIIGIICQLLLLIDQIKWNIIKLKKLIIPFISLLIIDHFVFFLSRKFITIYLCCVELIISNFFRLYLNLVKDRNNNDER